MKHAILILAAGLLTACGSTPNNNDSYTPRVNRTRIKADVNTYAAIYKTWGQQYSARQTDQALRTLGRLESHVADMVVRYGSVWRGGNMARFLIEKAKGWTYSMRKDYAQAMVHFERALGRKVGINGDTVADAHWGRGLILAGRKRFGMILWVNPKMYRRAAKALNAK